MSAESPTPAHYRPGGVTPWDLQRNMESSGSVFADARRTDAIEYAFRIKDDPVGDLRKGAHCLLEAAAELEKLWMRTSEPPLLPAGENNPNPALKNNPPEEK